MEKTMTVMAFVDGDDPDSAQEDPLQCATDADGDGYPEGVDCDDLDYWVN